MIELEALVERYVKEMAAGTSKSKALDETLLHLAFEYGKDGEVKLSEEMDMQLATLIKELLTEYYKREK